MAWSRGSPRTCASTRSAAARSASSRSAVRLPLRKKLRTARAGLVGHVDLALGQRRCSSSSGGRSTSSTSSASSSRRSGTVSRTTTPVICCDDVVDALEVLHVQRRVDVDARRRAAPARPASAWGGASRARSCGRARRPGAGRAGARAPRRGRTRAVARRGSSTSRGGQPLETLERAPRSPPAVGLDASPTTTSTPSARVARAASSIA